MSAERAPSLIPDDSSGDNGLESVTSLPPIQPPPSANLRLLVSPPKTRDPPPSFPVRAPASTNLSAAVAAASPVGLKEGNLWKRTTVFKQSVWQKKYAKIDAHMFTYNMVVAGGKSSSMTKEIPTSWIRAVNWLKDSKNDSVSNANIRFDLTVWTDSQGSSEEIMKFKAEDEAQCEEWVKCITRVVAMEHHHRLGDRDKERKSLLVPARRNTPPSSPTKTNANKSLLTADAIRDVRRKSLLVATEMGDDIKDLVNSMDFDEIPDEEYASDSKGLDTDGTDAACSDSENAGHSMSEGGGEMNDTLKSNSRRKKRKDNLSLSANNESSMSPVPQFTGSKFQAVFLQFLHVHASKDVATSDFEQTLAKFENDSTLLIFLLDNVSGKKNAEDEKKEQTTSVVLDTIQKKIIEICQKNDMKPVLQLVYQLPNSTKLDKALAVALYWWNLQSKLAISHSCMTPATCSVDHENVFDPFARFVSKWVSGKELTEELVNMLLWMLIDDTWSFEPIETMSAEVSNPGVWRALLCSLINTPEELRKKALESILVMFLKKSKNVMELISQKYWITWFCDLLEWENDKNIQIRMLVLQTVASILLETFIAAPAVFDTTIRTCFNDIVYHFHKHPRMSHRTILVLLISLTLKLGNSRKSFPVCFDHEIWENLINLSNIITNFVFKTSFLGEKPLEVLKLKHRKTHDNDATDEPEASSSSKKSSSKTIEFFLEESPSFWGVHLGSDRTCSDTELVHKFGDFLKSFHFEQFLDQPTLTSPEKEYLNNILRKVELYSEAVTFLLTVEVQLTSHNHADAVADIDSLTKKFVTSKNTKNRRSVIGTLNSKEWKEDRGSRKASGGPEPVRKRRRSIGNIKMVITKSSSDKFKGSGKSSGRKNSFDLAMLVDLLKSALTNPDNVTLSKTPKGKDQPSIDPESPVFAGRDLVRAILAQELVTEENQAILLGTLLLNAQILELVDNKKEITNPVFRNDLTAFKFVSEEQVISKMKRIDTEEATNAMFGLS